MNGAILALNAGSSSLKFALYPADEDVPAATGLVDRIGDGGTVRLRRGDGADLPVTAPGAVADHGAALSTALAAVAATFPGVDILAVGHRVVHGGANHAAPALVDESLIAELETLSPFAPLHQPHNLAGIRAAIAAFPGVPQVACFDTAFHRAHPYVNDTFALPRSYYERGVRRYGFHGLSYDYVVGELARLAPRLAEGRVVIAHLGNGASVCGIQNGRSVASTMGFSALDGLPMGTRCGQIDPGVIMFLMQQDGLGPDEIADLLYKRSGLLGLSGLSNDMRVLEAAEASEAKEAIDYFVFRVQREIGAMAAEASEAKEAIDYFVFRVQREIGAMAAAMGGIDALVFCGGIGENSRLIRARVCERMAWIGIELDHVGNATNALVISSGMSRTPVLVIPTNEELFIVRAVRALAVGGAVRQPGSEGSAAALETLHLA